MRLAAPLLVCAVLAVGPTATPAPTAAQPERPAISVTLGDDGRLAYTTDTPGNRVTLDAPLTTALDGRYGGGSVYRCEFPGRIRQVGVENLRLVSVQEASRPLDEDHAWYAVTLDVVEDAWVRQVTARHFAGSVINARAGARRVTIEDVEALARSFGPAITRFAPGLEGAGLTDDLEALKAKLGISPLDQRDFLNGPEFQKLFDTLWASSTPMKYRAWREYRDSYPRLVVLFEHNAYPELTRAVESLIPALVRAATRPAPLVRTGLDSSWCMARRGGTYVVYTLAGGAVALDLSADPGTYSVSWVDAETGSLGRAPQTVRGGRVVTLQPPVAGRPTVAWLERTRADGISRSEVMRGAVTSAREPGSFADAPTPLVVHPSRGLVSAGRSGR